MTTTAPTVQPITHLFNIFMGWGTCTKHDVYRVFILLEAKKKTQFINSVLAIGIPNLPAEDLPSFALLLNMAANPSHFRADEYSTEHSPLR